MPKHFKSGFIVSLSLPHCYLGLEVTGKGVNGGYELEIPSRFDFLWAWKGRAVVGNETNKNRRTINRERKLLPQIKHKFLVEEWFCDTHY